MNEHTHTKKCLARSIISAIENARDSEYYSDVEFRLWVQNNGPLTDGDDYLNLNSDPALAVSMCDPDCKAATYNLLWHEANRMVDEDTWRDDDLVREFFKRIRWQLHNLDAAYTSAMLFRYIYDSWAQADFQNFEEV